jgi:beta-glucosidase
MAPLVPALLVAAVLVVALAAVYFAPRRLNRPLVSADPNPADPNFPPGFLWATGEDAYQHEGGNVHADWYAWERDAKPFADGSTAGDCVDFYKRYEEDFARAKADGHNAHRIGFEWSRLEPQEGVYDEEAWEHYAAMLRSLKAKGFTVFVNLWHFTLPAWAAERGGWLDDGVMARWEAYAAECGRRFHAEVDFWSTMIDAQIYVLRGWFLGELPPCKINPAEGLLVFRRLLDAHAAAYRILKRWAEKVGMIYFFALYEHAGNRLDRFAHGQLDAFFNWNLLDALHTGRLDVAIAGGPRVLRTEERWRGTLDWIGVNYYYREVIAFAPTKIGFLKRGPGPGAVRSDMDWELYGEGLYRICALAAGRYAGVPLMITESGMADADDSRRPDMIVDHVAWTKRLVEDGYPVMGYTYWSLTDNLEWTDGFGPKFGLYRVDLKTFERTQTRSARVFGFIATNNRLPTKAEFDAL